MCACPYEHRETTDPNQGLPCFSPLASAAVNISVLLLLALILVSLFLGYPVLSYLFTEVIGHHGGFGLGGTNATGQIPDFGKYLRQGLIDRDTPKSAYSRMNLAGTKKFNLVFSDEFQTDGRSFVSWRGHCDAEGEGLTLLTFLLRRSTPVTTPSGKPSTNGTGKR